MRFLMAVSDIIDRIGAALNRVVRWLILLAIFISAANALSRKLLQFSSNGLLEVQWYLFAAVFMLSAGYVFLKNDHVRVDVLSQHLSARTRAWIDLAGIVLFLFPFCVFLIWQSWPLVAGAWASGETSPNAGGLIRWPVYALVPLGIGMLLLQSVSEMIKRAAFLSGHRGDPFSRVDVSGAVERSAR